MMQSDACGDLANRFLLSTKWRGITLVDNALPFGLRSSSKIFPVVGDAFIWIIGMRGMVHMMH